MNMKQYFIMIISAAVFAGISSCIAPEKWKKYLNAISGIMIVSVILTPLPEFRKLDLFSGFQASEMQLSNIYAETVHSQLKKRISADIKDRIKANFGFDVQAEVELALNDKMEITGIKEITVWTMEKKDEINRLLQEVYFPEKILFAG